jgi:long-chain acyl-CoA synthetase
METRDYLANKTPVPTGTLSQLFLETVDRFGEKVAYQAILPEGGFEGTSYTQLYHRVKEVQGGLRALGLSRGDRVAILSENRPQWSQVDFGTICSGIPLVPIHTNLTVGQIAYILRDSGARLLFVSTAELLDTARKAIQSGGLEPQVVLFDEDRNDPGEGVMSWDAFLKSGLPTFEGMSDAAFRGEALLADPQDTATILYTSGTTGDPKGVELTHNNLYSNSKAVGLHVPVDDQDSTLSFLPLSHSLQRLADYLFFSKGTVIYYGRSLQTIAADLLIVKPTKVVAPPRFYEKTYQKVMEQSGINGLVVRWAREVGEAWADEKLAGRDPTWILKLVYALARVLVFKRIHAGLGGRIIFFLSGSAPLAPEINKFFYSAGILILEGYGLSETSPATTVTSLSNFQIGAVGPPIPDTEIKIAQDGEVLIRGPQVMKGYFNLPEETAAAIDADGWFYSGDIGEIDDNGHLRITDRKKNILVTAGGKNIAPAPIENRLKGNRFVDQVVMIGDKRHFPALLIVPAFEALESWAKSEGVQVENRSDLLKEVKVQELMEREVFGALGDLASYETPKKLGLIEEEFTIEGGILTPNQKVKRRVVRERYGTLIDDFYDPANRDRSVFVNGD